MKNFNEWLKDRDEEIYNEINWRNLALTGAAAASMMGGSLAHAADKPNIQQTEKPAVMQKAEMSHPDVKEQNGNVYIRGSVKDSSGNRLEDMKKAEMNLLKTAGKYFSGKVPGGYKEITIKSDFMNGKTNELVWAWKISK